MLLPIWPLTCCIMVYLCIFTFFLYSCILLFSITNKFHRILFGIKWHRIIQFLVPFMFDYNMHDQQYIIWNIGHMIQGAFSDNFCFHISLGNYSKCNGNFLSEGLEDCSVRKQKHLHHKTYLISGYNFWCRNGVLENLQMWEISAWAAPKPVILRQF